MHDAYSILMESLSDMIEYMASTDLSIFGGCIFQYAICMLYGPFLFELSLIWCLSVRKYRDHSFHSTCAQF